MSTVIARNYYSVPAITPAKAEIISFSLSQPAGEVSLQIIVPDFDFSLAAHLTSLTPEIESGKVAFEAAVDANVIAALILIGRLIEDGAKFRPEQVSIDVELTKQSARAEFVASTLIALLALTGEVHLQIPDIQFERKLKFDLSLREISHWLQRRQIAYRLMVIERATGVEFSLPPRFSGDETDTIAFLYRAIVDRVFVWPIETVVIDVPATQEWLVKLFPDKQPTHPLFMLGPKLDTRTLLNHSIELGNVKMAIEDMIIEHADEVRRELAQNDGHLVKVVVRSLSGRARINAPEAPRLPDAPWDSRIQALIDLEPQLDARLAERYHALAAASLSGLKDEEIREILAGTEVEREALLERVSKAFLAAFKRLRKSLSWQRVNL
jgi:hypothetical protein